MGPETEKTGRCEVIQDGMMGKNMRQQNGDVVGTDDKRRLGLGTKGVYSFSTWQFGAESTQTPYTM